MKSRGQLEEEFSNYIIDILTTDINDRGHASLLVSGGSTPIPLFKRLSNYDIEWDKVTVTLVDERFVPDGHLDQNGQMIRMDLLRDHAKKATFLPLVLDSKDSINNLKLVRAQMKMLERPFSLVILGMGEDGHTASLFPDALELDEGMSLETDKDLIITHPINAPHERITFTRKALLNTKHLALHCYGFKKKKIIDTVKKLNNYQPYPIQGFFHQSGVELKLFWTE